MIDFAQIKKQANGMLPEEVYRAVYETAQGVKAGDIVEVGTAHGAATIALASGLPSGKVITIDKIKGGSRDNFGDFETNIQTILNNFKTFGVAERVKFHAGTSLEIALDLPCEMQIGLLMLDADGAIDRDFRLFYDRLLPLAPVIIDDYQPGFVRIYNRGKMVRVDQKRRLTALLVDYFIVKGYLKQTRLVGQTWFGIKPVNAPPIRQIDNEEIYDLYRSLIFADGASHSRTAEFINNATQKFPGLHRALKKAYMSVKN